MFEIQNNLYRKYGYFMKNNKLYEMWLASKNISQQKKDLLQQESPTVINQLFDPDFKFKFGTSGVRLILGEGNNHFNQITYTQLILGYIKFLETKKTLNKRVVLGRDNRHLSKEVIELAAKIFSSFSYEVYVRNDYEMLSTPITSFLIHQYKCDGGIMFTASHNPKTYNGFKVYGANGSQPLVEDTNQLESLIPSFEEALNFEYTPDESKIKFLSEEDIQVYFDTIKQNVLLDKEVENRNLKVVFSGHHGTTTKDMIPFLSSLGYELISVKEQNFEDPDFVNDNSSNPEEPRSFELAVKYAEEHNADVMIASDPDGDRMAIAIKYANKWRYLTGNQTGVLISYYLLKNKQYTKPPYIISTFISTRFVELFKKDFNVDIKYVDVGFKNHGNLISKLKETNDIVVGFEEAIGCVPSDINNDKDSYQTAALLLEIVQHYKNQDMTLIDVLNKEVFAKYGNWHNVTTQFIIDGDNWKEKGNEFLNILQNFEYDTITGFEIKEIIWHKEGSYLEWKLGEYSSIKFRLSGTEPKFKIYVDLYEFNIIENQDYHDDLRQKIEDLIDFFRNYLGL